MVAKFERPSINMSAIPVAGTGGLGLVGLVVIMAIASPAARWLLLGGLAGGAVVALTLILARRRHQLDAHGGDGPISLFSSPESVGHASTTRNDTRTLSDQHRLATC